MSFRSGVGERRPRRVHNLEIAGSTPAPATVFVPAQDWVLGRRADPDFGQSRPTLGIRRMCLVCSRSRIEGSRYCDLHRWGGPYVLRAGRARRLAE